MFSWISREPRAWQKRIDAFYDKYQDLAKWHADIVRMVTRQGYLEIPTGRRYNFTPYRNRKGELEWPRTKILNYPVQGYAAELVKLARILAYNELRAISYNGLLISSVHDSLVIDCPDEDVDKVCQMLYNIITRKVSLALRSIWDVSFRLPLHGEISFGPNQKDLKIWEANVKP